MYLETALVESAVRRIREALPSTWDVEMKMFPRPVGAVEPDAVVAVGVQGRLAAFPAEVRPMLSGRRDAQRLVDQIRVAYGDGPALLVTSYAGPAVRQECREAGISYVDESGWLYLRDDSSGLFVSLEGQSKPPPSRRREAAMTRLDGPGASAVIRALWGARMPIGVRALAEEAQVSPGTAAKVLPPLVRYGAIERDEGGAVLEVDRLLLLDRWTQDYGVFTTNPEVQWFLSARGVAQADERLRALRIKEPSLPVVHTGYTVAREALPGSIAPVIPETLLSLYAPDPSELGAVLGLRPTSRRQANVVIIRPRDTSLLRPDQECVPLPQGLADLMTMGGRFPELAEQVLEEVRDPARRKRRSPGAKR